MRTGGGPGWGRRKLNRRICVGTETKPAQVRQEGGTMAKYECPCGYVYDPEVGDPDGGIAPGTAFEDIPEDWVCPVCGLGKDAFEVVE